MDQQRIDDFVKDNGGERMLWKRYLTDLLSDANIMIPLSPINLLTLKSRV